MSTTSVQTSNPDSFYHLGELDTPLVQQLADRANALKGGAQPRRAPGRSLGLLFYDPSLRTSASFQRAAARLGLELVQLRGDSIWGVEARPGVRMDGAAAEHLRDAAAVLGRYVDVLAVRAFGDQTAESGNNRDVMLEGFMEHAGKPIINMESRRWHPCQALADWATLDEREVAPRAKLVLSWAWHPRALPQAVPNSTLCMAAQRGMDVVVLHPQGFELSPEVMREAEALAATSGGCVSVSHDPREALAGADVVYAKAWRSSGPATPEAESELRSPYRDWCVTPDWLGPDALFFHCLPIRRNVIATDDVIDGPRSCVLDQAEHRLHTQTALLEHLLP